MGEAKRRAKIEPYFGMRPKKGRGIFLSAPVEVSPTGLVLKNSSIDKAELRRAALFWDRLVWPDSRILSLGSNEDERLLEDESILTRPRPTSSNQEAGVGNMSALMRVTNSTDISVGGDQWRLFAQQHVEEYLHFEAEEPGQWVLSEGPNSLIMNNENFERGRGQLISLTRSIPLPNPDVPMQELLEFKERRSDEIVALNYELEKFYSQISRTSDPDFELQRLISVVDRQCANLIKASKESKGAFHIGDINVSLSADVIESAINRAIAWETALLAGVGLPIVGAVLGASASVISVSRGIGAKRVTDRTNPFRVSALMHDELV